MSLIAVIVVLYLVGEFLEGVDLFFGRIASFMNSDIGMVLTIAVVVWLTYRWYKARHIGEND